MGVYNFKYFAKTVLQWATDRRLKNEIEGRFNSDARSYDWIVNTVIPVLRLYRESVTTVQSREDIRDEEKDKGNHNHRTFDFELFKTAYGHHVDAQIEHQVQLTKRLNSTYRMESDRRSTTTDCGLEPVTTLRLHTGVYVDMESFFYGQIRQAIGHRISTTDTVRREQHCAADNDRHVAMTGTVLDDTTIEDCARQCYIKLAETLGDEATARCDRLYMAYDTNVTKCKWYEQYSRLQAETRPRLSRSSSKRIYDRCIDIMYEHVYELVFNRIRNAVSSGTVTCDLTEHELTGILYYFVALKLDLCIELCTAADGVRHDADSTAVVRITSHQSYERGEGEWKCFYKIFVDGDLIKRCLVLGNDSDIGTAAEQAIGPEVFEVLYGQPSNVCMYRYPYQANTHMIRTTVHNKMLAFLALSLFGNDFVPRLFNESQKHFDAVSAVRDFLLHYRSELPYGEALMEYLSLYFDPRVCVKRVHDEVMRLSLMSARGENTTADAGDEDEKMQIEDERDADECASHAKSVSLVEQLTSALHLTEPVGGTGEFAVTAMSIARLFACALSYVLTHFMSACCQCHKVDVNDSRQHDPFAVDKLMFANVIPDRDAFEIEATLTLVGDKEPELMLLTEYLKLFFERMLWNLSYTTFYQKGDEEFRTAFAYDATMKNAPMAIGLPCNKVYTYDDSGIVGTMMVGKLANVQQFRTLVTNITSAGLMKLLYAACLKMLNDSV